jgi:transposase InsO family protein
MSRDDLDRVLRAAMKRRLLDGLALRALMKATHLLGLALAERIRQYRDSGDAVLDRFAQLQEQSLHAGLWREAVEILASRWDKLPERQRPHFSPEARFRILRIKGLLAWSADETARTFRVSTATILRWEHEAVGAPGRQTVGSLLRPVPARAPLPRHGPTPRPHHERRRLPGRPLARRPSRPRGLEARSQDDSADPQGEACPAACSGDAAGEGSCHPRPLPAPRVDAGSDRDSRLAAPLLLQARRRPRRLLANAARCARLLHRAERPGCRTLVHRRRTRFGPPRHSVSDQGAQFTSKAFKRARARLGVRHRYGAIGRAGSIAVIERFFRTLKTIARLRARPPLLRSDLERRLTLAFDYYAWLRPHQGLAGATPAEVHIGSRAAHLDAITPPRGRPGEWSGIPPPPFELRYLDPDNRLPYLVRKAA